MHDLQKFGYSFPYIDLDFWQIQQEQWKSSYQLEGT